jgi:hypothetical protein
MAGKYNETLDRKSAFEILSKRAEAAALEAEQAEAKAEEEEHPAIREFNAGCRYDGTRVSRSTSRPTRKRKPDGLGAAVVSVILKELKGTTGRRIVAVSWAVCLRGAEDDCSRRKRPARQCARRLWAGVEQPADVGEIRQHGLFHERNHRAGGCFAHLGIQEPP